MSITPAQCRAARALANLTQEQLARRSEVSKRTIAHFEADQRQPVPATLAAIKRAFETAGVRFTERGVELAEPAHA